MKLVLFYFALSCSALAAAPPNILIVLVDDAGYGDFSLPAGRTQMHGWFHDAEGKDLCGAFFARVLRKQ